MASSDKKESFIFYRSFYDSIKKLNKKDQLTLYSHICRYALGEKVDDLEGIPSAIFDLIKPQIDANLRRYENGLKGGRPKTKTEPSNNLDVGKAKRNVNVNVNDNVNVNENVNVNDRTEPDTHPPNKPPTLDQLKLYCYAEGIRTDVEKFYSYNSGKGWPMEWKAALELWVKKDKEPPKQKPNRFNDNFESRKYGPEFFAALEKEHADRLTQQYGEGRKEAHGKDKSNR